MLRRAALGFVVAAMLSGCLPTSMSKLVDAAHMVTNATRFGRLDIVEGYVHPDARRAFVAAHAEWGPSVRILDVEYAGTSPVSDTKAVVAMNISWQRVDESTMRATSLTQQWERGDDGWIIMSETIVAGDKRLLRNPSAATTASASQSLPPPADRGL
jgi:hypothetical protein